MHVVFHIRTVVIQRGETDNCQRAKFCHPERPISARAMITVLKWKMACINLFITYSNIELKRTKLTSHRHQTYMDMSDRYRLRDDNSPDMEKVMHWSIYRKAWYRVIRFLPRYLPMGWYRCGTSGVLRMGKVDVIAYKYVIIPVVIDYITQKGFSVTVGCVRRLHYSKKFISYCRLCYRLHYTKLLIL